VSLSRWKHRPCWLRESSFPFWDLVPGKPPSSAPGRPMAKVGVKVGATARLARNEEQHPLQSLFQGDPFLQALHRLKLAQQLQMSRAGSLDQRREERA
jgi:hypothetical protein